MYNYIALSSTLFVFPVWVTFDATSGLQGLNCCILQNQYGLEIGFFPTRKCDIQNYRRIPNFKRALLEAVPQKSSNCYISGNRCSSVVFDHSMCLRAKIDSDIVKLKGYSFFLLTSEDGRRCGLLCKRGNFELKCIRPTNLEEGFLSIDKLLEQPFSDSPSAKKARIEEQGETSQSAMEESRRARIEELGENSKKAQKALEEAEEEERACAETLMHFLNQQAPQ